MKRNKKRSNKRLFFLFSLVTSVVILIGATYSWVTYSDQRVNAMKGGNTKINVAITGNTSAQVLAPNLKVDKNIQVRNDSKAGAFIRLSLKEVLLSFDVDTVDQTGNANLKEYPANSAPKVVLSQPDTWVAGNYFEDEQTSRVYKGMERSVYDYQPNEAGRAPVLKDNVTLTLSKRVLSANPTVGNPVQDKYWLYHDGYFYYSERVYSGNSTEVCLESIGLSADAPNQLKGALYGNPIKAEGVLASEYVYDAWNIPQTASNPVYQMLQKQF